MKNTIINLVVGGFLLFLFPQWSIAKWAPIGGPGGGQIFSFDANTTTIFAGTNAGVFRSVDKGLRWQEINAGLSDPAQRIFAAA